MIPSSLLAEIKEMTRPELIQAKDELIKDTEIPKKDRSQLLTAIENRLYKLKNGKPAPQSKPPEEYSFASMERDGEKLSVVTTKTLGELVLDMEPDVVYGFYKVSKKEFEAMKELGYGEV